VTRRIKLAVSLGDPWGVGPETTAKSILALRDLPIHFILHCNRELFEKSGRCFWAAVELLELADSCENNVSGVIVDFVGKPMLDGPVSFGNATPKGAKFAYDSLLAAARSCMEGRANALVTAPLSKHGLKMAGLDYSGQTEILKELAKVDKVVMAFFSGDFRVVLTTRHIALKEVAKAIDARLIERTISITADWLRRYESITDPRIGVLALNPHGGESGLMGDEESIIIEGIANARSGGYSVSDPIVPDTAFMPETRAKFDIVIGMFHDQVLIPFKMVAFRSGVNATLGMPFIRTSPDHGTAYDIAGKDIADPESTIEAIKLADRWARAIA